MDSTAEVISFLFRKEGPFVLGIMHEKVLITDDTLSQFFFLFFYVGVESSVVI